MVSIARYTIDVEYKFDKKSISKIDRAMKDLEKRVQKFSKKMQATMTLDISRFNIDQRRLNIAVGNALDIATTRNVLEVNRFVVDQGHLNRVMTTAMRNAARVASASATLRPGSHVGGMREAGIAGRHVVGAGGVGGLAARAYAPVLALAAGGYGLSALNRRNQEVVSAQLQTQAVVQQAGGSQGQGVEAFDWLRNQGNRIGFNYLEAAPDYNKLLAGLTGAGVGLSESQNVFKGFAELARVNKLDKVTQNRLFRALSQVAGKGKLQAEELTGQISEALPSGTSLFAQAYQKQIGGNLTGSEAISALMAAMKKGQVKSDILTFAGALASEQANRGGALGRASLTSQSQQALFQNRINDIAVTASNSGVESGFARLFRALNDGLKEANPMVESLARGFDQTSKYVSSLLLSVQSLQRFFQGRDSYLGEKLFPDEESQQKAFQALEQFKTVMTEMDKLTTNIYNGWDKLLSLMDNSSVLDKINNSLSILSNGAKTFNSLASGDISGALDSASAFGKKYVNSITSAGRTGANAILYGGQKALAGLDPRVTMDQVNPWQISAPFSNTDSDLDWGTKYKADQARMAAASRNQYALPGINQPLSPGQKAIDLSVKMEVKIDAANPEDFNQKWQNKFTDQLQSIFLQYSEKE